jgi:hypothetical protein
MRLKIITFFVAFLVMIGSGMSFFSSTSYSADSQGTSLITNEYVLEEALPEEVTSYIKTRIERYVSSLESRSPYYTIGEQGISRSSSGYTFVLLDPTVPVNTSEEPPTGDESEDILPTTNEIAIDVEVQNYGNFFSIVVYINGQKQDIA